MSHKTSLGRSVSSLNKQFQQQVHKLDAKGNGEHNKNVQSLTKCIASSEVYDQICIGHSIAAFFPLKPIKSTVLILRVKDLTY